MASVTIDNLMKSIEQNPSSYVFLCKSSKISFESSKRSEKKEILWGEAVIVDQIQQPYKDYQSDNDKDVEAPAKDTKANFYIRLHVYKTQLDHFMYLLVSDVNFKELLLDKRLEVSTKLSIKEK